MTYLLFAATTSTAESPVVSIFKISIPVVVGGLITLLTWYFTRKAQINDGRTKIVSETYKSDAEQASKQREFLITENQSLYNFLKEELEMCRKERLELDATISSLNDTIDGLKKRLSKIEIELQAWEMGLKTPQGFTLNRIEDKK